jgi:hypothetical protein
MGMQQTIQHKILQTYHSKSLRKINGALRIPFVHEEITLHANKYKLRTTGHSNQLVSELFHQSNEVRRLQKI